jgi:hypothetical protein
MAMKSEKLVQHLSEAVRKLGYKLRVEEGNFRGGQCIFGEDRLIILNRRMTQEERAEVLARVLNSQDLDQIFLLPEVRSYVNKTAKSQETLASGEGGTQGDS